MSSGGPYIEPARTAVVAVDFQAEIMGADGAFAPLFHAEVERTGLIPVAARLLDDARAAGVKVVYSRATFQPGYTDLVANLPLFANVAAAECLVDGTPAAAIMDVVAPHTGDVVLAHPRVSCFHGTPLDVILRGGGIDTVVLFGVATNLAVESSARVAADLGYRVLVVPDASSTTSKSAHEASLASLEMFAEITPSESLLAALEPNTPHPANS
jgi:nicotinamidase-related amidase